MINGWIFLKCHVSSYELGRSGFTQIFDTLGQGYLEVFVPGSTLQNFQRLPGSMDLAFFAVTGGPRRWEPFGSPDSGPLSAL